MTLVEFEQQPQMLGPFALAYQGNMAREIGS
jgi:hypothetical protein